MLRVRRPTRTRYHHDAEPPIAPRPILFASSPSRGGVFPSHDALPDAIVPFVSLPLGEDPSNLRGGVEVEVLRALPTFDARQTESGTVFLRGRWGERAKSAGSSRPEGEIEIHCAIHPILLGEVGGLESATAPRDFQGDVAHRSHVERLENFSDFLVGVLFVAFDVCGERAVTRRVWSGISEMPNSPELGNCDARGRTHGLGRLRLRLPLGGGGAPALLGGEDVGDLRGGGHAVLRFGSVGSRGCAESRRGPLARGRNPDVTSTQLLPTSHAGDWKDENRLDLNPGFLN